MLKTFYCNNAESTQQSCPSHAKCNQAEPYDAESNVDLVLGTLNAMNDNKQKSANYKFYCAVTMLNQNVDLVLAMLKCWNKRRSCPSDAKCDESYEAKKCLLLIFLSCNDAESKCRFCPSHAKCNQAEPYDAESNVELVLVMLNTMKAPKQKSAFY